MSLPSKLMIYDSFEASSCSIEIMLKFINLGWESKTGFLVLINRIILFWFLTGHLKKKIITGVSGYLKGLCE
jgi:hypothetical protein